LQVLQQWVSVLAAPPTRSPPAGVLAPRTVVATFGVDGECDDGCNGTKHGAQ
jgi:hypothetical protein